MTNNRKIIGKIKLAKALYQVKEDLLSQNENWDTLNHHLKFDGRYYIPLTRFVKIKHEMKTRVREERCAYNSFIGCYEPMVSRFGSSIIPDRISLYATKQGIIEIMDSDDLTETGIKLHGFGLENLAKLVERLGLPAPFGYPIGTENSFWLKRLRSRER